MQKTKEYFAFPPKEKLFNFTPHEKFKKILKGAVLLGVEVKQDKSLDKLSGRVLFPEKLEEANKIISKLKLTN